MQSLNEREMAVYEAIRDCVTQNAYAPSVRDLAERLGYHSTSTVQMYLDRLEAYGYITRKGGKSRSIALTPCQRSQIGSINYLIVVDMQNDFIDGALGTPEAQAILPYVKKTVEEFDGTVLFTRDTHLENYMETQEGSRLPVPHCIKGSDGWQICDALEALRTTEAIDKPTFGSEKLVELLRARNDAESITLIGVCTDICVISNAMLLKAAFCETPIRVDAKGCAGVTPESHRNALNAMRMCQIDILNEES